MPSPPQTPTHTPADTPKAQPFAIAVAIDYSPASEAALAQAALLCRNALAVGTPAVLHLLHTPERTLSLKEASRESIPWDPAGLRQWHHNQLDNYAAARAHPSKDEPGNPTEAGILHGLPVVTHLTHGVTPAGGLIEHLDSHPPSLLVIGTQGQTPKGLRALLGSTAERLLHRAPCPVLTVHPRGIEKATPSTCRQMLFASDFSSDAPAAFARLSAVLTPCLGHAPIYELLHINTPNTFEDTERTERVISTFRRATQLTDAHKSPAHLLSHHSEEEGILMAVRRLRPDVVALATHPRSRLAHLFDHGIAEEVAYAASCPVLTLRM